jgi:hypothetical protein
MIQIIDNPILLYQILDLAKEIPDTPIDVLENMLLQGIGSPDARIVVDKKGDEVRGFMFGSIERFQGENVVYIQSCYVSPKAPHAFHELYANINTWAKEKFIKTVIAMTQRPEAFARKYKFTILTHVVKREVV